MTHTDFGEMQCCHDPFYEVRLVPCQSPLWLVEKINKDGEMNVNGAVKISRAVRAVCFRRAAANEALRYVWSDNNRNEITRRRGNLQTVRIYRKMHHVFVLSTVLSIKTIRLHVLPSAAAVIARFFGTFRGVLTFQFCFLYKHCSEKLPTHILIKSKLKSNFSGARCALVTIRRPCLQLNNQLSRFKWKSQMRMHCAQCYRFFPFKD